MVQKRRRRIILYFNLPFCKSMVTRVGKCFLEIVDRNFTKDIHIVKFLRVSYSCMPNLQLIMAHNRKMLDTLDNGECVTAENKIAR